MAPRSKADLLPDEVRRELEQRLIKSGFSDYAALTDWLTEQGFEISRSAVHRFGSRFEDRIRALRLSTEKARAVVQASPDDAGDMNEALVRLTQQAAFDLLMEMELDPETIEFPKLVRAISDLNRSSVTLKKYQAEMREKLKTAAEEVRQLAANAGVSDETLAAIDARLQGVV
jgi:hypothetical protein